MKEEWVSKLINYLPEEERKKMEKSIIKWIEDYNINFDKDLS